MASFKGDENYRCLHDEEGDEDVSEAVQVHELARHSTPVLYRDWLDEHFEVLSELYSNFKRDGESVFGRAFFELGTFTDYVDMIFTRTVLQPADLLMVKTTPSHVGTLGAGSRGQHGISVLQTTDHRKSARFVSS